MLDEWEEKQLSAPDVFSAVRVLQIEQPLERKLLLVPSEVNISPGQNCVEWKWKGTEKYTDDVRGSLFAFARLAEAADVERFVKRWGPLNLLPTEQSTAEKRDSSSSEALGVYYRYARQVKALLSLAADLSNQSVKTKPFGPWTKAQDWYDAEGEEEETHSDMDQWGPAGIPPLERQRFLMGLLVNNMVKDAYIYPELRWDFGASPWLSINTDQSEAYSQWEKQRRRDEAQCLKQVQEWQPKLQAFDLLPLHIKQSLPIRKRPSRLYMVLVLQLLATLTAPEGIYRCTHCGVPHCPRRAPRGSTYCEAEECKREAHNEANKRSYQKRSSAQKRTRST